MNYARYCAAGSAALVISSLLGVTVAAIWIVMTAFGSAALAQQAQTSVRSWTGTIDWRVSTPNSRLWGRLDLTLDYDGQGNLKGQMTGDSHAEAQMGPSCRLITQTPAKHSANLLGQYTPGRNTMSLAVADPKFEQGQFSLVGCPNDPPGGPFEGSGPLGQPVLAQLLSSLTVRADGSVEASGEGPVAPAETQATLHLKLTLRSTDCRDRGFVYAGTLDGRVRSEPSSNSSVVDSPASGTRLRYTRTQQVNGQTWYYVEPPGRPPGWFSGEQASCTRPTNPPLPRIVIPLDEGMKRYQGRTADVSAARG